MSIRTGLRNRPQLHIVIGVLVVMLMTAACGRTTKAGSVTPTVTAPTAEVGASSSLTLNPPIDVTADGLHVFSNGQGIACTATADTGSFNQYGMAARGIANHGWLVLATNRLMYDAGEVRQMNDYMSQFRPFYEAPPAALPTTLGWAQGAQTTAKMSTWPLDDSYCHVALQVTNVSAEQIQIPKVGLQLQAAPQATTYSYRLIDVCTYSVVIGNRDCTGVGGGGSDCNEYGVQILLAAATSAREALATPVGARDFCTALILDPGATDDLFMDFGSATALTYSGILELKVATASGTKTLLLSKSPSVVAFADPQQFTCYGLAGNTFTLEAQGAAALSLSAHNGCL